MKDTYWLSLHLTMVSHPANERYLINHHLTIILEAQMISQVKMDLDNRPINLHRQLIYAKFISVKQQKWQSLFHVASFPLTALHPGFS